MITSRIIFNRKKQLNKDREASIEIRITVNRKVYYVSTGQKVRKSQWKDGQVVNRPDALQINDRISTLSRRLYDEVTRCISTSTPVDIAAIKANIWAPKADAAPIDTDEPTLLNWMEQEIEALPIRDGTRKHYRTVLNRLTEYGRLRRWQDLSVSAIYRLDEWLHHIQHRPTQLQTLQGQQPGNISQAAVYNYHKCIKSLLRRAYAAGLIDENPYDRLQAPLARGRQPETQYLTEEEVRALMSIQPLQGSRMQYVRDLFVVQLFTGLSFSDLLAVDFRPWRQHPEKPFNGRRVKTAAPYTFPLLPPVLEILERYNWQLPKVDNQHYNTCLKALGMAAGIPTPLHSHLARHTFATLLLKQGARIENVSRMLGHTNIKQTQRYAKVLAESVAADISQAAAMIYRTTGDE